MVAGTSVVCSFYFDVGRFPDDATTFEMYVGSQLCASIRFVGGTQTYTLVAGQPVTVAVDSPDVTIRVTSEISTDGDVGFGIDDVAVLPASTCGGS